MKNEVSTYEVVARVVAEHQESLGRSNGHVRVTAFSSHGAKGKWSRPDLVHVHGDHVTSYEVKVAFETEGVYEALSHARGAHSAYLVVVSRPNIASEVEKVARRHGIGLIVIDPSGPLATWTQIAESVDHEPEPDRVAAVRLAALIPASNPSSNALVKRSSARIDLRDFAHSVTPYGLDRAGATTTLVGEITAKSGITQRELAQRSGVTEPLVSSYVRGLKSPSENQVKRLAEAAGLEIVVRRPSVRPGVLVRKLREELVEAARRRGYDYVYVYGSIARNEDGPESDVDLLVEGEKVYELRDLLELEDEFTKILGVKVDLEVFDERTPLNVEREARLL